MPGNQRHNPDQGDTRERKGGRGRWKEGAAKLSDNSNNRIQLTNNENLKNLQPTQSNSGRALHSAMTTNASTSVSYPLPLSPAPLSPWFPLTDCIFRHLCGRRWVSFVSLISCLSVARFNFKSSSTHFHEWLSPGKNGTEQDRTAQNTARYGTVRQGTEEDSLGPHWDRQLTMLSRNFTRR